MPKIIVDSAKGLHQVNGNSATNGAIVGHRREIEILTAAKTLTKADSGKIFYLDLAGGFTVTLPAIGDANCDGCSWTFIVKTQPTTAYIVAGGTADKMSGVILSSSGAAEDQETDITGDQVNFVANTAVVGDKVEIIQTATGYHAYGITGATGGLTITG